MNAYIVDDEEMSRSTLMYMLKHYCPEITVTGHSGNYDDALIELHKLPGIDILFLDINLGKGKTGFDLLKDLQFFNGNVIFISAYGQFAVEAFKYAPVHYLLKPIEPLELVKAINRLEKKATERKPVDQVAGEHNPYVWLPYKNGLKKIETKEIIYLKADGSYCHVVLTNDQSFTISKNMKHVLQLLKGHSEFIQIHRSYSVNRDHIVSYLRKDNGVVLLSNDLILPVSIGYKPKVKSLFR
jgi:two-component system, LytTR family, response regulator